MECKKVLRFIVRVPSDWIVLVVPRKNVAQARTVQTLNRAQTYSQTATQESYNQQPECNLLFCFVRDFAVSVRICGNAGGREQGEQAQDSEGA